MNFVTSTHVLTLGGVKITASIEGDNEEDKAKLETISHMIINAFRSRDKKIVENEFESEERQ